MTRNWQQWTAHTRKPRVHLSKRRLGERDIAGNAHSFHRLHFATHAVCFGRFPGLARNERFVTAVRLEGVAVKLWNDAKPAKAKRSDAHFAQPRQDLEQPPQYRFEHQHECRHLLT